MQWLGFVAATLAALAGVVAAVMIVLIWREGSRESYEMEVRAGETLATALLPDDVERRNRGAID
jgi:hypothetical protein